MNVGILAAALPSLKPAFRWLLETAKNIATGANSGRGTRTSVMSPGVGYKRQFSSGYLCQRDDSHDITSASHTYNVSAVGPVTTKMDPHELELRPIYNVTVAGVVNADDKTGSPDGSGYGRRSNNSSDAILRIENVEELATVPENQRGIFRTTEVTVVRG